MCAKTATVYLRVISPFLTLLFLVEVVEAQYAFTWLPAGAGNWQDANNWDRGSVPYIYDTAIVNQGQAQVVSQDAIVGKLFKSGDTIKSGDIILFS